MRIKWYKEIKDNERSIANLLKHTKRHLLSHRISRNLFEISLYQFFHPIADYSEFQSPEKLPGKKKTKKKQTLLFATSMARGGK